MISIRTISPFYFCFCFENFIIYYYYRQINVIVEVFLHRTYSVIILLEIIFQCSGRINYFVSTNSLIS